MKSMSPLAVIALFAGAVLPALAEEPGPIDRVVTLLKTLSKDLNNDEKTEQGAYDKYACWCEETTARKAANIEDAKSEMKRLGQMILKKKGTVAVRTAEIEEKQEQIKENQAAQESATSARGKENGAWAAETAETSQAMSAINTAMDVLIGATSFLQEDQSMRLQATVSAVVAAAPMKVLATLTTAKMADLRSFAQVGAKTRYAPQSATIQGILSDMYTTMGVDVMDSTALEAKRNRAFEDYMAEKDAALRQLQKILAKKQMEKAEAEAMLAEATESYDDTSNQLEADVKFFDITKDACKTKTDEWKVRSDLRVDEIEGIDEALKLLTSDDAKKLFAKAIKPGMETTFLQVGSAVGTPKDQKQAHLMKLYGKLKAQATKSHSLRLASIAASVKLAKAGHFDKVIKAIDDLIGVLGKEQDSDTKKRDECEEQYQDIEQESKKLEWKITNNKAKVQKLENLIELRTEEKKTTIAEIKSTNEEIKDMKAERKKENEEFVEAKKLDIEAIALIKKAKEVMMDFYSKNNVKVDLLQESADPLSDPDVAPDASFSGKGKRKGQSKGIVAILTMVIEDLTAEVANETTSEEASQLSFEKALAAAEKLVEDLTAKKVSLEEAIAKRGKEKTAEKKDQKANEGDLDAQEKEKASIETDCDYMISKYEERRGYREAESEALSDAKEFLVNYFDGADDSFVQTPSKAIFSRINFEHVASPALRK